MDYNAEYVNRTLQKNSVIINELITAKVHAEVTKEIAEIMVQELTKEVERLKAEIEILKLVKPPEEKTTKKTG